MAMQVFGGYGYSKEYPIERMLRDSRGWPLAGGTVQMQRINIQEETHRTGSQHSRKRRSRKEMNAWTFN